MAKFECKNCNHFFTKFCDNYKDVENAECPECSSHWVELVLNKQPKTILPTLPYIDPSPKPNFGPFPNVDPWPPSAPRYWCWTKTVPNTTPNIDNCTVHSYSACFGKID